MKPACHIPEHPLEVLRFCLGEGAGGHDCALVTVVMTQGPSSRAPGTQMAVSARGLFAGYISNGCIDADIAEAALARIKDGTMQRLRYGAGSPFVDIVLPCGGALEVVVAPAPSQEVLLAITAMLEARRPAAFHCNEQTGTLSCGINDACPSFWHLPAPCITVAGRGAEALAFLEIATAAGYDLHILSPDRPILERAQAVGAKATPLQTTNRIPDVATDPFSAVLLLFHDHDWELPILQSVLEGEGFYIGAMGSRNTQAQRLEALHRAGVDPAQTARICGPVGLIPGARDAQTMAISALSEIIKTYHATKFTSVEGGHARSQLP